LAVLYQPDSRRDLFADKQPVHHAIIVMPDVPDTRRLVEITSLSPSPVKHPLLRSCFRTHASNRGSLVGGQLLSPRRTAELS
jgi:hypothetical protein